MKGGPFNLFEGSGRDAVLLGQAFCQDLFGERYEDVLVFQTFQAWSDFSYGSYWDYTWVGVDTRLKQAWLLAVTDGLL